MAPATTTLSQVDLGTNTSFDAARHEVEANIPTHCIYLNTVFQGTMLVQRVIRRPGVSWQTCKPLALGSIPRRTLTSEQMKIVQSTIPALEQHGMAITSLLHKRLLDSHPELKNVFNTTHQVTGEQPAALAHAVWAYASNIDNPAALQTTLSRIGHKHASLGITPEQYPILGEGLLAAIKTVLGAAADDQVLDAWGAAYEKLAEYCIRFEGELHHVLPPDATPLGGGGLPAHKPGQFVTVRRFVPELASYQPRQYGVSGAPDGKSLRISVTRAAASDARPAGRVAGVLHEDLPAGAELDVSMPLGGLVLDVNAATPVVLVSRGVGLTPAMAMLKTLVDQASWRRVVFVHAARGGRGHAMKAALSEIVANNPQVRRAVFYQEVTDRDQQGFDYDFAGGLELSKIKDVVLLPGADFYICGPLPFIKAQSKALMLMGVDEGHVHMELFGSPSE
ncbi:flavohemoprotein [Metarhizium robertsii ARSEF 23]|uniref:nitric oxide dioxygenase n=1 Tax=Metarhizium robertsii (strain ARSEF 23 / ATCC MYA-3075) TaxID=655844 RepID=E9EJD6_METRA|nr:flavohemoprotein [Metarhizium robertsii ARSEF 23]EFZ04256.2 flavohemoprotein [Metarhizium robertsii ARSEF 23]